MAPDRACAARWIGPRPDVARPEDIEHVCDGVATHDRACRCACGAVRPPEDADAPAA